MGEIDKNKGYRCRIVKPDEQSLDCLIQNPEVYYNGIQLSDDYYLIFNNDLKLIDLNRACNKTLRDETVTRNTVLGKHMFFFFPDFEDTGIADQFAKAARQGDICELEDYLVKSPVNKDSIHVQMRMLKSRDTNILVSSDITEHILNETLSHQYENQINTLSENCNNLNITLEVLLQKLDEKQREIEKNYCSNLEEMVFPMIDILKNTKLDERQAATVDILEANLKSILDPFVRLLNAGNRDFTQRELQIANLIRMGKSTKEISEFYHLSCKTVDFHRANIRKRLDINHTKGSLRNYLLAISEQARNNVIPRDLEGIVRKVLPK